MKINRSIYYSIERGLSWLYRNTVRQVVPVKESLVYSGVKIDRDRRYGDAIFIPRYCEMFLSDKPEYEKALITALNKCVRPGMTVSIVGGGVGVTAVIAANLVGSSGAVSCYEASKKNCRRIQETAKKNGVGVGLKICHGLVGPPIGVYHEDYSAPSVSLDELEDIDVLELDCEGSEKHIIQNLKFLPRYIIVESHGVYGAPTVEIERLLVEKGYRTELVGLAEPSLEAECIENDVRVLLAEKISHFDSRV